MSVTAFHNALADGSPTPGGGAAAALTGATAAALVEMVCNVTLNDDDFAEVHAELRDRRDEVSALREDLTAMADDDAAAFEDVLAAYRRPGDDPERSRAIQEAMTHAAQVPLETAEACLQVIEHGAAAAELGNQNAVTDAAAAVLLGRAALETALYNVDINLTSLEDDDRVDALSQRRSAIAADAEAAAERVRAHLAEAI